MKARDVKDRASICRLLAALGHHPAYQVGKELYYHSPLNQRDDDPSFALDEASGRWYNFCEPVGGGNIIDLGKRFWPGLEFPALLEKIVALSGTSLDGPIIRVSPAGIPTYEITAIHDIGYHPAIANYLDSRGILAQGQKLLKEIYYTASGKNYYGAGWQNETGSWEISNTSRQKYCLGAKATSFIPGGSDKIAVFESMFDYFSWLTENPFTANSVLVLNSVALVQTGMEKAKSYRQIETYFDNDQAGRRATQAFQLALPRTIDRSPTYEGYKDYNDKLVAQHPGYYYNR
jgi:hypothetical protein